METSHTTLVKFKLSTLGIAMILIPGIIACVLLAVSAGTASAIEGNYDYMSEGPGGANPLDRAALSFNIALVLLAATVPGIVLLGISHRSPRAPFVFVIVAAVVVIPFVTYFLSWMLARPGA